MRVIAGSARHLPLKTIDSLDIRPTTDRIKETLFNMIQSDIAGSNFLDLFAGSGAIGIEALSRGAKKAVFVENNEKAIACIKDNLTFTKLTDKALVMECDAMVGLKRLENKKDVFDYIFMDPPYKLGIEEDILTYLSKSNFIDKYTTIIIEANIDRKLDFLAPIGLECIKEKKYKTNKHFFIKMI